MKQKPLIALPAGKITHRNGIRSYEIKEAYIQAVHRAEGQTVLIPATDPQDHLHSIVEKFDGFLFSGGGDIQPHYYGGGTHASIYGIDPERDAFELALIPLAIQLNKPILAICRGIQVLNVALGGTLYYNVASQVPTAQKHNWFPGYARDKLVHEVKLAPDSQLANILGITSVKTNSLHHQSVHHLSEQLITSARSEDGLIEAVEMPGQNFVIGVQWHPEWLQNDASMIRLFKSFVLAC